jgi:membrane protease YdiL (CAAX protease family)
MNAPITQPAASTDGSMRWKVYLVLLAAALLGVVTIIPYSLALQGLPPNLPMPLEVLLLVSVLQNMVLFAVAIALGLWLGGKVGLGAPMLRAWLAGDPQAPRAYRASLGLAVILGVASSLVILVLDVVVFSPLMPAPRVTSTGTPQPAAWQGLLASFYGGINEELLLRLCLMSILVWMGCRLTRSTSPGVGVAWTANILAALLFGLGHLPATSALFPLTGSVIVRALVLNGLGGVVFGWLYWRRGLLLAMTAHFSADIVLHVLFPLLTTALAVR